MTQKRKAGVQVKEEKEGEEGEEGKDPEEQCPSQPVDLADGLARMEKAILGLTEVIAKDRQETSRQLAEAEERIVNKLPFFLR